MALEMLGEELRMNVPEVLISLCLEALRLLTQPSGVKCSFLFQNFNAINWSKNVLPPC